MIRYLNVAMLFGLIGVAVPILIHLLNRYRYREIDWGAMELLRRAMNVRSRRVRIEDLILLILRCLATGLLAYSMARPTVTAEGAKYFGGESRVGVVIALDGSMSMSHRPGVQSRFDLARQKVREVLGTLRPGRDQVSLVLMGQRPRILLRNAAFDEDRIRAQLDKVAVLSERLNLDAGLEQAADLLAEVKAPVRECYIISDSQDLSWRQISQRARKSLMEMDAEGRVYYLSVATGSAENLAVTNFRMTSGALRTGSVVRYVAEVTNFGRQAARNVPVTLQLADKTADRRVLTLVRPGQTVPVPLYAKFTGAGNVRLAVRLERDALTGDDIRYAAARVHNQVRVLVIDGDPGRTLNESETFYLTRALVPNPEKPSQATIRLTRVPSMEMALQRPAKFDIVVLANVPDMRTERVKELFDFVRRGGGLIVFLGDKINPKLLNVRMRVGDESLLAGEVGEEINASPRGRKAEGPAVGWPIEPTELGRRHPLGRFFARLPKQLVDEARVTRLFEVRPAPNARVVLNVAGPDKPLVVEKPLGRGHVLLVTTAADRDWGNVAINPAYLILLHEAVTHLTRQSHEREFAVARPLVIPLPHEGPDAAEQAVLVDPDNNTTPIQITDSAGQRVADCGLPERPGIHRLQYSPRRSSPEEAKAEVMVAVNVNPLESDVKTLTSEDLRSALSDVPVSVPAADRLADEVRKGRTGREIWRVLMTIALVVLLVESLLAWHFSRKLDARTSIAPSGLGGQANA